MNAVLLSSFETGHITDSTGYPWLQKFEGMFEQIVKAYEFIRDNDMMIVLPGVVENKAVQKNAWHVFPIYVNRNNQQYIDFLSYQLGVDIHTIQKIQHQNKKKKNTKQDKKTKKRPNNNLTFY